MDTQRHSGRIVLATGAGSGIGRASEMRFAGEGARDRLRCGFGRARHDTEVDRRRRPPCPDGYRRRDRAGGHRPDRHAAAGRPRRRAGQHRRHHGLLLAGFRARRRHLGPGHQGQPDRRHATVPGGAAGHEGRGPGCDRDVASATPSVQWACQRLEKSFAKAVRMAQPDEIAALVSWLSSDEASNVNGAVSTADGGWMA
jgi:NAD(P)-dependent dehydrogenase (short-subunit alcohol dehydrogenase family)